MAIFAYINESSGEYNSQTQMKELQEFSFDRVFVDALNSMDDARMNRPNLAVCLQELNEGDTLFVTRLDRLGRHMIDLLKLIFQLTDRGVTLKAALQDIDTSGEDNAFMQSLEKFAEFEFHLREERSLESSSRDKRKQKKGITTLPTERVDAIQELAAGGHTPQEIQRELGGSVETIRKLCKGVRVTGDPIAPLRKRDDPRPSKIPSRIVKKIKRMRWEGKTCHDIASELNVSQSAVWMHSKEFSGRKGSFLRAFTSVEEPEDPGDVVMHKNSLLSVTPELQQRVRDMAALGHSLREIAEATGLNIYRVRKYKEGVMKNERVPTLSDI